MLIVSVIAWAYVRFGTLPEASAPALRRKTCHHRHRVASVVELGQSAKEPNCSAAAGIVAAADFLGGNELLVLFGCGFALLAIGRLTKRNLSPLAASPLSPICRELSTAATATCSRHQHCHRRPFSLNLMFSFFPEKSALSYGSGSCCWRFLARRPRGALALADGKSVARCRCRPVHARPGIHHRDVHRHALLSGPLVATVGNFPSRFYFVALSALLIRASALHRSPGHFSMPVRNVAFAWMAVASPGNSAAQR